MTSSTSREVKWHKEFSLEDVDFRRLVPLWRHGLWMAMLFLVAALWTQNRIVVNELRDDLGRTMHDLRDAKHRQSQLQLQQEVFQSMQHLHTEAVQRQYGPVVVRQVVGMNGS
jgi:hypothetical protein